MIFDYMDVHKVSRCAQHKKDLNPKSFRMKNFIIDSYQSSDFNEDAFKFFLSPEGLLSLSIPVYEIELVFKEQLVVINDSPLLKFVAAGLWNDTPTEVMCFYLNKSGLVFINEYKPANSHDYESTSLFMEILDSTFKALKSANKISY